MDPQNNRVNIVTLVVGNRGTGKTTYMLGDAKLGITGVLQRYQLLDPNKKILIVDTFDHPSYQHVPIMQPEQLPRWQKGMYRIFSSDTDHIMYLIDRYAYNAVIVFEDATKFIGSKLSKSVKNFVIDSKQKNLDLYFMFHFLMGVPPDLARISDYLTLHKTNEIFSGAIRGKFPNPKIEAGFKYLQTQQSKFAKTELSLT